MLNQSTQDDAAAQKRSARLAFNDEVQAADVRDDIAVWIIILGMAGTYIIWCWRCWGGVRGERLNGGRRSRRRSAMDGLPVFVQHGKIHPRIGQ